MRLNRFEEAGTAAVTVNHRRRIFLHGPAATASTPGSTDDTVDPNTAEKWGQKNQIFLPHLSASSASFCAVFYPCNPCHRWLDFRRIVQSEVPGSLDHFKHQTKFYMPKEKQPHRITNRYNMEN